MSVNLGGGSAGDDQMAEALRDAGQHVLAHLYESYAARLFDYCVAVLGDEVAAVIAVQDSLVAVDAQISKLPDPDRLRVSLYSVARRQCLGKLPRRRVKPSGGSETATVDKFAAAQAATADAGAASAEGDTLPVVTAALAGLAGRDREVLNLAFRHGIEGADLAAVLGVSGRRARAMLSGAGTRFQIRCARYRGDRVFGPEMLAAVPLTAPPLTLRLRMTRTALALGSYRRGGAGRTGGPGGSVVPVRAGRRVPRAMVVSSLGLVVLAVPGALLYRLALTSPAPIAARVASGTQTTQTPASAGSSVISPAPGPRGSARQHKLPPLPGLLGPTPLGVLPVPPPRQAGSPPTPQPPHTTPPPTTPPPSTPPPTKPPTTPPPTTPPPTTPPPTTPPPTTPPPTTPPPTTPPPPPPTTPPPTP